MLEKALRFRALPYNDTDFKFYNLLGERWSKEDKNIRDYSCNVYGVELAKLDLVIKRLTKIMKEKENKEDKEYFRGVIEGLKLQREALKHEGEALWLSICSELTQLAVKVPMTPRTIKDE